MGAVERQAAKRHGAAVPHEAVADCFQDLARGAGEAQAVIVPVENAVRNPGRGEDVAVEDERHAAPRGHGQGGVAPGKIARQAGAPIAVEAEALHGQRREEESMAVEGRRQAERRPAVPRPDVGETRLELEIGVIKLELHAARPGLVVCGPGLDRERSDIPSPAGIFLDEIEAQARLLHDVFGHERIGLESAGRGGIGPDGLDFEVQKRALALEAGGQRPEEKKSEERPLSHDPPRRREFPGSGPATARLRHRKRSAPGKPPLPRS